MDIPLAVIGGKGAHGLAIHLLLQDHGISDYCLIDPAPHWLQLYSPQGPMQAMGHLRSPHELDFSLGDPSRSMRSFREDDGSFPLQQVYSLAQAADPSFNRHTDASVRAPRHAFWRYANQLASRSQADAKVIPHKVVDMQAVAGTQGKADSWQLQLEDGSSLHARVVVLATGLLPHLYIPQPWQAWWRHLSQQQVHHAFALDYNQPWQGKNVTVVGSSNITTWECALALAERGAKVTLLSRYSNPIERQLPMPPRWLRQDFIAQWMHLPWHERRQQLKRPHIPASALPGMAQRAWDAGIEVLHHARLRYASPLWEGIQVLYKHRQTPKSRYTEHLVVATGTSPNLRQLPLLRATIQQAKPPTSLERVVRHRPLLDAQGRWKNLPPLYPMGSHAMMRAGHAANTLASASCYLPLCLPDILHDAGLRSAHAPALPLAS